MRLTPAALALTLALTACGSSDPGPSAQPTPSVSPTPTLPPVADDTAKAKAALLTAAELGKPWIQPKKVNEAKNAKGERCPGQKKATAILAPRARADRDLTKGSQAGADIGSFEIRVYEFGQEEAIRAAAIASATGCASYTSNEKLYVEIETVASPPAIAGADEVHLDIERVYADKTKKTLYYVRHYYEARTGRVVTMFELAYIQPKSDPTGKDTTVSAELAAKQVAKTKTTFGL